MKAHLINMHLLVPRSRSSVKVRVVCQGQGRISMLHFSKNGCFGGISVSQTLNCSHNVYTPHFEEGGGDYSGLPVSDHPYIHQ